MRARLASGEQQPANASACEPGSVRERDNRRGKAAADPLLRAGNKGCWFKGGRFSGFTPPEPVPAAGTAARKPRQREGRIIIIMVQPALDTSEGRTNTSDLARGRPRPGVTERCCHLVVVMANTFTLNLLLSMSISCPRPSSGMMSMLDLCIPNKLRKHRFISFKVKKKKKKKGELLVPAWLFLHVSHQRPRWQKNSSCYETGFGLLDGDDQRQQSD